MADEPFAEWALHLHRKLRAELRAEESQDHEASEEHLSSSHNASHSGGEASSEERTIPGPETAMLFIFLCLAIGCASRFLLEALKSRFNIRIPYSVFLLIVGGLWGGLAWRNLNADQDTEELATISLAIWTHVNPRLILFIFLPALIFEGSMGTNFYAFSNHCWSGLMLAGPGMLVQSFLIAVTAKFMLPYGWTWVESLLFGGVLSATDPVAVIALLKELGLLPDLRVLIEAESLMNDGTAIVVFELCELILVDPQPTGDYVAKGFQLVLGAPALGTALYLLAYTWLLITSDPVQDTMVTICAAYLCYFVAEGTDVKVSGVLAVLTLGLLMAAHGNVAIDTEEAQHMLHAVWTIVTYCADTIIFVLAGAIIVQDGFLERGEVFAASDWGYLFALYFCLLLIRGTMVFVCAPVLRYSGYGLQERVCSREKFAKYMAVLIWGGLRGAVGLALALIISVNEHLKHAVSDPMYNDRVLLFTAGIVVLTTLINAATLEKLILLLGLGETPEQEKDLLRSVRAHLRKQHKTIFDRFQDQNEFPHLAGADWQTVQRLVGAEELTTPASEESQQVLQGEESMFSPSAQELMEADHFYLGRYLTSLRSSYTGQWHQGLLSSSPYRDVLWAIDRALDHHADKEKEDPAKRYEWGWLNAEGYLEMPGWCRSLQQFQFLKPVTDYLARYYHANHLELVLAVARAHEETLRCEVVPDDAPDAVRNVRNESLSVKEHAEHRFAEMKYELPEIASSVQTRQACRMILHAFKEEIEGLHEIAQISDSEFERLEHTLYGKQQQLLQALPKSHQVHENIHQLPVLKYFPDRAANTLAEALDLSIEEFEQGAVICKTEDLADSVIIVTRGVVRLAKPQPDFVPAWQSAQDTESVRGPGSVINENQFILSTSGFEVTNAGTIVAMSHVHLYKVRFEELQKMTDQYPSVLERMWRQSGHYICTTNAELFHNDFNILDFDFTNVQLQQPMQGDLFRLPGPSILVSGAVSLEGDIIPAIAFLDPQVHKTVKIHSDKCTLLVHRDTHQSIVERRSMEMARVRQHRGGPKGSDRESQDEVRRSLEFMRRSMDQARNSLDGGNRGRGGSLELPFGGSRKRLSNDTPRRLHMHAEEPGDTLNSQTVTGEGEAELDTVRVDSVKLQDSQGAEAEGNGADEEVEEQHEDVERKEHEA